MGIFGKTISNKEVKNNKVAIFHIDLQNIEPRGSAVKLSRIYNSRFGNFPYIKEVPQMMNEMIYWTFSPPEAVLVARGRD